MLQRRQRCPSTCFTYVLWSPSWHLLRLLRIMAPWVVSCLENVGNRNSSKTCGQTHQNSVWDFARYGTNTVYFFIIYRKIIKMLLGKQQMWQIHTLQINDGVLSIWDMHWVFYNWLWWWLHFWRRDLPTTDMFRVRNLQWTPNWHKPASFHWGWLPILVQG